MGLQFRTLYHLILEFLKTLKNLRGKLGVELLKVALVSYDFITSITLGNSISHIFGTSHSGVLWATERVAILALDLTMAASVLKCYLWLSFLCVFNVFYYCKFNIFNSFVSNAPSLYHLKYIRKLYSFLMFPGDKGRVGWERFKLSNQLRCKQSIFVNMA